MIRSPVTATRTKPGVLAESTELELGQRITALRAIERERGATSNFEGKDDRKSRDGNE